MPRINQAYSPVRATVSATVGAKNDTLTNGVFEKNKSYVIGTTAELLANDVRIRAFTSLNGADTNGDLAVTGGTLKVVNGEIIFTTDNTFNGGTISFDYTAEFDTLSKRYSTATATIETELKPSGVLYTFDDAISVESFPDGSQRMPVYKDLLWDNFYFVDGSYDQGVVNFDGTGYRLMDQYENDRDAFNGYGLNSSVRTSKTDFDFITGEFASAWKNDMNIFVKAFDDGIEVGSATIRVDINSGGIVDFRNKTYGTGVDTATFSGRFESIDRIDFSTDYAQFVTDNWLLAFE